MFPLLDRAKFLFHVSDQLSNRRLIGDRSIFRLKLEQVQKSFGGDGKNSMELDVKIVLKNRGFGELQLIVRQSPMTSDSIACRGGALHAGPSDTLFELAWIWLCKEEAGAVEGFGGRARRVPRSLACGMCGVCIMTAAV